MTDRDPGFQTRAVHGASLPPVEQQTPSVPIYQTSTFRFDDAEAYAETIAFRRPGYTYTRGYGNPTLDAFERLVASLEDTQAAMSFSSGMAGDPYPVDGPRPRRRPDRRDERAVRRRVRAGHEGAAALRRDGRSGGRARSGPRRRGVAGRRALLHGDDREPDDGGRRPRRARRVVPAARRARGGRQHVRLAGAVRPGAARVRVLAALHDEVPGRAPRPHRRRDRVRRRRARDCSATR